MLITRSVTPSPLGSDEHRPGHALDLQHTGTSSIDDFTGAPNLREQTSPARNFVFLPNVGHALPASLAIYTSRDLAIDSFAASYPSIKSEKVEEIVDETIDKLENIMLHDLFAENLKSVD